MAAIRTRMYLVFGYLSAACIVLILLIILAQVVGRLLGFIVPSAEDFTGYALAGSTFFGLAYTFHEGGHIRVNLMFQHWSPYARRVQEFTVLLFALLLCSFMAFYACHMVWESYVFEDVSSGYIPVPLWLPQIPMALGLIALLVAVLDAFSTLVTGNVPGYIALEKESLSLEEESISIKQEDET